jgi:WD40 repeat protein
MKTKLRVWDAETGKLAFEREDVTEAVASTEGDRLAVVVTGPKPQLLVLDPANGTEIAAVALANNPGPVARLSFPGKDRVLVVAGGFAELFDTAAGKSLLREYCPAWGYAASGDGKLLAVRTGNVPEPFLAGPGDGVMPLTDAKIHLFDVATGKKLRELKVQARAVGEMVFSPDGKLLAYCGVTGPLLADGVIDVLTVEKGERVASFRGHTQAVNRIAFRPDGRVLASGGADHTVRLWHVPAADAEALPEDPPAMPVFAPGPAPVIGQPPVVAPQPIGVPPQVMPKGTAPLPLPKEMPKKG